MNWSTKQSLLDKRKKNLKRKATNSELRIKDLFKILKVSAKFQKGFISGNFCIVDFYLPVQRICFEIDGGYHNTPEQIKRDKNRDDYLLNERHFTVIHITNEIADTITAERLFELINNPI